MKATATVTNTSLYDGWNLVRDDESSIAARYEYDPTATPSPNPATSLPIRIQFSSQYWDEEANPDYYGYISPSMGRVESPPAGRLKVKDAPLNRAMVRTASVMLAAPSFWECGRGGSPRFWRRSRGGRRSAARSGPARRSSGFPVRAAKAEKGRWPGIDGRADVAATGGDQADGATSSSNAASLRTNPWMSGREAASR